MASITKRGQYQHQAIIRRKGYKTQTRTFETSKDAKIWAATIESEMARGLFIDRSEAERTTLGEVLERYRKEVSPAKRGARAEISRLKQLEKHPLALRTLATLRGTDFAKYRDERLEQVGPKTVLHELSLLSVVLNTAKKDWSIPVENSIPEIRKPQQPQHRERRLMPGEEARLLEAADNSRTPCLRVCIVLAIETGMRRGEIASLTWDQIDIKNHIISLDITKNGDRRQVPLSEAAEKAILALPRPIRGGPVTSFYDSNGLGAAFRRACKRAGLEDLHFHDLRHEAASRLAKKLPTATLAKIMGWRDLQMAMRYYNPLGEELVEAVRAA